MLYWLQKTLPSLLALAFTSPLPLLSHRFCPCICSRLRITFVLALHCSCPCFCIAFALAFALLLPLLLHCFCLCFCPCYCLCFRIAFVLVFTLLLPLHLLLHLQNPKKLQKNFKIVAFISFLLSLTGQRHSAWQRLLAASTYTLVSKNLDYLIATQALDLKHLPNT